VRQDIVDDMRDAFDQLDPDNLPPEVELKLKLKRSAWTAVHQLPLLSPHTLSGDVRPGRSALAALAALLLCALSAPSL
jgi:hypothetical protein